MLSKAGLRCKLLRDYIAWSKGGRIYGKKAVIMARSDVYVGVDDRSKSGELRVRMNP